MRNCLRTLGTAALLRLFLGLGLLLATAARLPGAGPEPGAVPAGRWAFMSYGSEQGLTNLSIWALEQDQDGFLWAGTESGLFRYDGSRFQRFSLQDGLPADLVRVVFSARNGSLWLGTLQGVALRRGDRFQALGPEAGLDASEVFALAEDPQGRVWVGSDHGLYRQRQGNLAFEPQPGWAARSTARALCWDGQRMLVASGAHLYACGPAGAPVAIPGPWTERLEALARDGAGRLWVRSRSHLFMRPPGAAAFQDLTGHLRGNAFFDASLRVDPEGNLLIPTAEGLARVKGEAWDFLGEAQGLPTPWVNRALVDREGSLWVCGTGLHRGLGREAWRMHTQKEGIPGTVVECLLQDRQHRFWIGTEMGLCRSGPQRWQQVPGTRGMAVLAMVQAPDGAIWIGGTAPFLRRWEPDRDRWQDFAGPTSTVTRMVREAASGDLYVATRRQGLWRAKRGEGQYALEPVPLPGGTPEERIQGLCQGSGGRLWVAGALGLACLEGGRWRRYTQADGLAALHVTACLERANGDLWLSYLTVPGIRRYRLEQGRLAPKEGLDARSGLSNDLVHFIREDARGRLWVGTSFAVNLVDGASIQTFGVGEGLPGDDCIANAFLAEANGDVWVGTQGGLGLFRADAYRGKPASAPAHILSARFGNTLLTGPAPGGVAIQYRDAHPEFRFAGLSFLNESKVQHQIRLLGYETEWRGTDIRQASYTNLRPGLYRFEVRAGYGLGVWSQPASLAFRVLPAWWQTWWMRTLEILGALGVIGAAFRLRLSALHRKYLLLDQLVKERTRELQEANSTLRQLTVTDPLTGLKNRRYLDLTIEEDLAKVRRDHHALMRGQLNSSPSNIDLLFLMVDLDHFKLVNDTYGHSVGDSVLQQLRDRLLGAVRDTDAVIRWGGEEFLIVAKGTNRTEASLLAERILADIRERPFHMGEGLGATATCSLGFAPLPFFDESPMEISWHQVVDLADRCLYAAKKSGRNGWVGILDCGPRPSDPVRFLEHPGQVLLEGRMVVATSFPDPAGLQW